MTAKKVRARNKMIYALHINAEIQMFPSIRAACLPGSGCGAVSSQQNTYPFQGFDSAVRAHLVFVSGHWSILSVKHGGPVILR